MPVGFLPGRGRGGSTHRFSVFNSSANRSSNRPAGFDIVGENGIFGIAATAIGFGAIAGHILGYFGATLTGRGWLGGTDAWGRGSGAGGAAWEWPALADIARPLGWGARGGGPAAATGCGRVCRAPGLPWSLLSMATEGYGAVFRGGGRRVFGH